LNAVPKASATGSISISNTGTGPLTAKVTTPKHSTLFSEVRGGNGLVIDAGGNLEVTVVYSPTKKASTSDQVVITSDDPTHKKPIKVKIKGTSK